MDEGAQKARRNPFLLLTALNLWVGGAGALPRCEAPAMAAKRRCCGAMATMAGKMLHPVHRISTPLRMEHRYDALCIRIPVAGGRQAAEQQ
jgi:hypothetical protein